MNILISPFPIEMIVDYKSIKYNEKFDGFPEHMVSLSAEDYKSRLSLKIKGRLGNHQICSDELISVSYQNDNDNDIEVVASVVLILDEVPREALKTQNGTKDLYMDTVAVSRDKLEEESNDFDLYDENIVNRTHSPQNYEVPASSSFTTENSQFGFDDVQDTIPHPERGGWKLIHIF